MVGPKPGRTLLCFVKSFMAVSLVVMQGGMKLTQLARNGGACQFQSLPLARDHDETMRILF